MCDDQLYRDMSQKGMQVDCLNAQKQDVATGHWSYTGLFHYWEKNGFLAFLGLDRKFQH